MRHLLLIPAAAVMAGLAACGDTTGPDLSVVTVDTLLAQASLGGAASAAGLSAAGVPLASVTPGSASACLFNATSQSFVCPDRTVNGLTLKMSYQLLDASNNALVSFSPTVVAAIRTIQDVSGTTTGIGNAATATVTAHSDQILSGLLSNKPTLNGTSTNKTTSTVSGATLTMDSKQTTTALVLPARGSGDQYPQSGSIKTELTITSGSTSSSMSLTMTFNGTSSVTYVLSSGTTTQTCTMDLRNPSAQPSCH